MGIKTPRLYRKSSGIYWVRILLRADQATFGADEFPTTTLAATGAQRPRFSQSRNEIRRSLGTSDAKHAHKLAAQLNAVLASTAQSDWRAAVSTFHFDRNQTSTWTLPGGLSAEGEEESRRLDAFLYAIRNSGQQASNAMSSAAAMSAL